MEKTIILQQRDFVAKGKTYTQYRINIPLEFVRRLGWINDGNSDEPQQLIIKFKKSKDRKFLYIDIAE